MKYKRWPQNGGTHGRFRPVGVRVHEFRRHGTSGDERASRDNILQIDPSRASLQLSSEVGHYGRTGFADGVCRSIQKVISRLIRERGRGDHKAERVGRGYEEAALCGLLAVRLQPTGWK
jgi:hypothetical protein